MTRESATTPAFVLRSVAYRDADLILTLYTRERGRLSALARAARKSRKRFGGCTGLFTVATAHLTSRGGSELWTLSSAELTHSFAALAHDMARFAHASYATELVRELTAPEVPDPRLFDLTIDLYSELVSGGASTRMLRAFELRLLDLIGLAPVLDRCVGCGRGDVDGRGVVLDPGRGGVCCPSCAALARQVGVRPLSSAARRALHAAQTAPSLAAARSIPVEPGAGNEARDAVLTVITGHLGRPLRSVEFIAKISGAARRRES